MRAVRSRHTACARRVAACLRVNLLRMVAHFPATDLELWDVEARAPDGFVLDQLGIDGRTVAACVQQIADSRTRPPQNIEDVLSQLERDGLVESVAAFRAG
jgi:hypothetical protein